MIRPFANALPAEPLPRPRSAPAAGRLAAPAATAPKRLKEGLAALGIETRLDLLESPPFRFEDFSSVRPIASLAIGEEATVLATVDAVSEHSSARRRNLRIIRARLHDASGSLTAVWFNQRYLLKALAPGTLVLLRGLARPGAGGIELAPRLHQVVAGPDEPQAEARPGLMPVYHASSRVSSQAIAVAAEAALACAESVADPLPPRLRADRRLPSRRDALVAMHRPRARGEAKAGRERLAYEELLLLQLALLRFRAEADAVARTDPLGPAGPLRRRWQDGLPFLLTGAQRRAIEAIDADLARPVPMQRLLQGDVGSGKTAVALAACLRAVEAGGQAALMAPTETLALQHLRSTDQLLDGLGVEVVYLSGDVPKREADARRARIAEGAPLIAVGTHALLNAEFPRLLVAVVDEQHRFGVEQRDALGDPARPAHVLHMTATPIPRSLALTVYGDLDVTEIDELPAGRKEVKTSVVPESKREDCYRWIVGEVQAGRQVYVVCSLVEGSEEVEARAAEEEAERLREGPLREVRVGCMHGQLKAPERQATMRAFAAGELDVLVATTVIEVGVDVPNATIMVIEDADRFGLAQLHQLRGRVGRGREQSWCFLFESAEPTPDGRDRLEALRTHSSGFELAEIDLEMRGEGRLLGLLQSGRSELVFARLVRDRALLERARGDARELLAGGVDPLLAEAAEARFGELIAGMRRA